VDEKSRTVFEEDVIVAHLLETDAAVLLCIIIIAFRFYYWCVYVYVDLMCVKKRK